MSWPCQLSARSSLLNSHFIDVVIGVDDYSGIQSVSIHVSPSGKTDVRAAACWWTPKHDDLGLEMGLFLGFVRPC